MRSISIPPRVAGYDTELEHLRAIRRHVERAQAQKIRLYDIAAGGNIRYSDASLRYRYGVETVLKVPPPS